MAVKLRKREATSRHGRTAGRPWWAPLCIALVAFGLAALPGSAAAQQYDVLRAFPLGQDDASLGFRAGDTVAYDEKATLASVDSNGVAYIVDRVNTRVVISKPAGIVVLSRPWLMNPIGIVGLSDGSFVVSSGGVFRRLDPAGNVLGSVPQTGLLEHALPNERFIVRRLRKSGAKFLEYNSSFEITEQHFSTAGFAPTSIVLGAAATVRFEDRCWIVPRKLKGGGRSADWSGDRLRYIGVAGFIEAVIGGATTAWKFPVDEIAERNIPPVVAALEDANIAIVRRYTSTVLGRDGEFYSLAQTPDRYELVRWDLTELPRQTYPPVVNTLPTIVFDGPTTASVGDRAVVWVRGHDAEPGTLALTVGDLPDGARFTQSRRGNKAALDWEPTPEQVGEHTIHVTVEDLMCGRTTQSFVITVQE